MTQRTSSNEAAAPVVVLIHGAWLGGWVWDPVLDRLRAHGVAAIAPTLTGLGDRSHLMGPTVDLPTHVMDIVQSLRFLSAPRVILVGHSYGGAIVSEVASEMPERVAGVVVLDGFLGEAERSIVESYPAMRALLDGLISAPSAVLVPPPDPGLLSASTEGMAEVRKRMRPMPMRAFQQRCMHSASDLTCERDYVRFSQFPFFEQTVAQARDAGWRTSEIDADHLAPVTAPDLLVGQLLRIVHSHRGIS